MDYLEVNSTMGTTEPESSEVLKSETNTEVMNNSLNSEGSQDAHTNVTLQDLSPIRFHGVHGERINMSNDYRTAIRRLSSDELFLKQSDCMVFSSRPIAVNEKVFLYLEQDPNAYMSSFYFGFTDCDPNTMTYLKWPDWGKMIQLFRDNSNDKDSVFIFHFYVKSSGEVWCGINDTDICILFEEIYIDDPLWAVIMPDYDYLYSLKLIDSPNENQTEEIKPPSLGNPSPSTSHVSTELGKTNQKRDLKENETKLKPDKKADLDGKAEETKGSASAALGRGRGVTTTNVTLQDLPSLRFHRVHGVYIKMSDDYYNARLEIPDLSHIGKSRKLLEQNECLVFSSRPIAYGEKVYLRLKAIPRKDQNSIDFGLTNCDPNSITDLKSWHYSSNWLTILLVNYLNHFGKINNNNTTHILNICVKQSGEVTCCLKEDTLKFGFKTLNISGPFWVVLKLPHNVTDVEFIPSLKGTKSEEYKILSKEKPSPPTTNALVESSVISESEFKNPELKTALTVQDAFKQNLQTVVTSNTPAELVQPISSTDDKYKQKPVAYDARYFGKIVEYHLNRVPEDKRMKCMQKILEVLDNSSK